MKKTNFEVIRFIPHYYVGEKVLLKTDSNGIPLDHFWRNRLKEKSIKLMVEVKKDKKEFQSENKKSSEKSL